MRRSTLALCCGLLALPVTLAAQGGYEIEVYGTGDMVAPHTGLIELRNSFIFRGPRFVPTGTAIDSRRRDMTQRDPVCTDSNGTSLLRASTPTSACRITTPTSTTHTFRELMELSTGVTSWWDVAAYGFGSHSPSGGISFDGEAFRSRMRTPESWHLPVGLGLSVEAEHDVGATSEWNIEVRPIIDFAVGRWYISLNPALEKVVSESGSSVNFSPAARASFDFTRHITVGAEYYGDYGQVGAFTAATVRPQQLFGTIDLKAYAGWEIQFGAGAGLSSPSDRFVAKFGIGRRFGTVRDTVTI